jgi:hypothetical protein
MDIGYDARQLGIILADPMSRQTDKPDPLD